MPYIFYCILRTRLSIEVNIGTFDKYEIRNTKYGIRSTEYGVRERLLDTHRTGHTKCQTRFNLRCVVQLRVPCLSDKCSRGKTNCLNWRNDSELTRCQTKPSGHLHCATNADYPRTLRATTPKV